jgi:hypothetical protein
MDVLTPGQPQIMTRIARTKILCFKNAPFQTKILQLHATVWLSGGALARLSRTRHAANVLPFQPLGPRTAFKSSL